MNKYRIARNERTSLYEVHLDGCAHLISPKFDYVNAPVQGASGAAVAAEFEARNEGCLTKVGPCAKGA